MVLSNIFRLSYENLRWVVLTPEAGGPARGTDATNLVLEGFLKLLNLGHLTTWRVCRSDNSGSNGGLRTSPLELWQFQGPSAASEEDLDRELLALLPGFQVVKSGVWSLSAQEPTAFDALAQAISRKLERAFAALSYHRFGRVFVRTGRQEPSLESPPLACEIRLLSSPSSLYIQAHVSRRNCRLLRPSDLSDGKPLKVICSPSGEYATLRGFCSPALVARLTQAAETRVPAPTAPFLTPSKSLTEQGGAQRSKARRKKRSARTSELGPHVEVEIRGDAKLSVEKGRFGRVLESGPQLGMKSEDGRLERAMVSPPLLSSENEHGGGKGWRDGDHPVPEAVGKPSETEAAFRPNSDPDRQRTDGQTTDGRMGEDLDLNGGNADGRDLDDGWNLNGRNCTGRTPDRLILPLERVLVPLPDLAQCATELRVSLGLERVSLEATSGLGMPVLAGWPSEKEGTADESSTDSGSSADTDAEDETAEGQSGKPGVKSEVAGYKRDRAEGLQEEERPPLKVRKLEEESQGLELLGLDSEGGAGPGDAWWAGDEVGPLADFADFGDAFGDFGELPGTSPKTSLEDQSSAPTAETLISLGGTSAAGSFPAAQDETPSQVSPEPIEVDPGEPLNFLLEELLLQPTTQKGPDSQTAKGPSSFPTGNVAHRKVGRGVAVEGDGLFWFPPEYTAVRVSLPACSDSSNEEVTRVQYRPEEKKVKFIRAVLGQEGNTAYEALPPGTPGVAESGAEEVQFRGRYSKRRVRKNRNGELGPTERTGEHLEICRGQEEGAASAQKGLPGRTARLGESAGRECSIEQARRGEERNGGNETGRTPMERFVCRSVVGTDMVLLQREVRRLVTGKALLAAGSDREPGGETGGAQPSRQHRIENDSHSIESGVVSEAHQREPRLLSPLEGTRVGIAGQAGGVGVEQKRRLLSPLLLQPGVASRSRDRAAFRNSAWEESDPMLGSGISPASAATVAEVLASDVSEAFRAAFGEGNFSGPLTVDELCQDPGGEAIKPPPAMQVGSPAIEHPVTPPQLWTMALKSPAGRFGPRSDTVDAANAETMEAGGGVFKLLSPPTFLVGYQEDWLKVSQGVLKQWEKAPLEPFAATKPVVYYAFCPAVTNLVPLCARYLKEVGSAYEMCQLGSHVAASLPSDLADADAPRIVSVTLGSESTENNAGGAGQRMEGFVEGIRTAVERLGLVGVNGREGREGSEEPCTVIYVILPICTDDQASTAIAAIAALLSSCKTGHANPGNAESSPRPTQISLADTRLTLQFLSELDVRRAGFQPGAPEAFKRVAFDTYRQARRTYRKLPRGTRQDEFPASKAPIGAVERSAETGDAVSDGPLLFEPLVVLASHPPICPVGFTGQSEEQETGELEAGEHAPEAGVPVHCCYAWANGGATLVSVWTDGQGELLDAYAQTTDLGEAPEKEAKIAADFRESFSAESFEHLEGQQGWGQGRSGGPHRRGGSLEITAGVMSPPNRTFSQPTGGVSQPVSETLLRGLLDQCENLLALAEAALPEGELPTPCHVIISRLGVMPRSESHAWARLLGGQQHDVSKTLRPVLHASGAYHSPPGGAHAAREEGFAHRGESHHGRSLSLEMGGEALPPELERFPFLEQQCLSPASPGPFGFRQGGDERGFQSPPETGPTEPRGSLASVTLAAMEREGSLQLVHGGDERQGRGSNPIAGMSARALPQGRNDQLFIPSKPLGCVVSGTCGGREGSPSETVASGYLLCDVRNGAQADGDASAGMGTFVAGDDWPVALRVDLIGHFGCNANVDMPALVSNKSQGISLLESVIEGFHALSWLNDTETGGCRSSVLPMHAAMAERIVEML